MIKAKVKLTSLTPISFSKHIREKKPAKEQHSDFEKRIWRERLHYDEKTKECYIPSMMVKNCVVDGAQYLSIKIPGKGNNTYAKHFKAGIYVEDSIPLNIKRDKVRGEWLFVPSDGKKNGSGTRVDKCFPMIDKWSGEITVAILDEEITREVFEKHISEAGLFIGLGRFRPRVGGELGRFKAKVVSWTEE